MIDCLAFLAVVGVLALLATLDARRTRRLQAECDRKNAAAGGDDPRKYNIWGY